MAVPSAGAEDTGADFLEMLQELGSSRLIRTKQEAMLHMAMWMGDRLGKQSRQFNETAFRENAMKAIYANL